MKNKFKCGIYKITCIPSKGVYIGQTIQIKNGEAKYRWYTHKNLLKSNKHANPHLQNAFNLYGENNFCFEVIEICQKRSLNKREIYWIKFYREKLGIKKVYNISDGGMSYERNVEMRKHMSEAQKKRYKNNIKELERLRSYNYKRMKKIICVETKEVFDSINRASKKYNISVASLWEALNGINITAGGFHWCYTSKYNTNYKPRENKVFNKIICVESGKVFNSVIAASKEMKINRSSISNCITGIYKKAGGYTFKYINENDKNKRNIKHKKYHPVICVNTGKKYNSAKEAAKEINTFYYNIINCCEHKNGCYTVKDLTFVYLKDYKKRMKPNKTEKIKVLCEETGEIFNSMVEAGKNKNINPTHISFSAKTYPKYRAGGYHWKKV